jgi:hypothetical protein
MNTRALVGAYLCLGFMVGPLVGTAHAQTADSVPAVKDLKRPVLGPHRFIPNALVEDPFPRTFVRSSLGIGKALDLDIFPQLVIGNDTLGGLTGDLVFALLDFQYSQRIKDWMGFYATVKIRGRLGDNVGALFVEGVTLTTGFDVGWMFKFLETDRIAMSATAQVTKATVTGINIFSYIEGVIDSQPVPAVREVPVLWVSPGLRFAWAANTWLGVTANGEYSYGEGADRTKASQSALKLSSAASLDFASLIHVPVGLVLAAQWASDDPNAESNNSSQSVLLRIAYTGRDDFVIALDLSSVKSTLFSGREVDVGSTRLSMRYYF